MALVVDASALVFATTEATASAVQVLDRLREDVCHAPHLIDAEFGNVLRRKVARNKMPPDVARELLDIAPSLIDHRHEHHGFFAVAAWGPRENLTFYDALYVVLAAMLDQPLLTLDHRLARVPGLPCRVEVPAGI